MKGRRVRWLSSSVALVLAFAAVRSVSAEAEEVSPFRALGVFARALAHIETSYVDAVDQERLVRGALSGMMQSLDPHSDYLDPEAYRLFTTQTEGRFAGVGVEISVDDGWLVVLAVYPGGPAERAGIRPGDRLLRIEGRPARDMRIDESIRRMRGEPGTAVDVAVRREGHEEALEFHLVRAFIEVRAVEARVLPNRIVHVRLRSFQDSTALELARALDVAVAETERSGGVRGILLDLRDNGGGLLQQAILVADEFLSDGVIVSTRGRGDRVVDEVRARRPGTRPDWPMVVLVNGLTASAAEIVAGALRDHRRAVVVGVRTFGKGSVQNVIELPDGGAIKLTTARYFTPSGRSIQALGIEPDVLVEQVSADALRAAAASGADVREATLEGHLEPSGAVAAPSPTAARNAPRETPTQPLALPFADDYQARMALQVVSALATQAGAR